MRKLTATLIQSTWRLDTRLKNVSTRRWTTSDFYNRYYYPPPTVFYHPPDIGDTQVMERNSLETALLEMSQLPNRDLFAIIFIQGKQHKVTFEDFILVNQIPELEVFEHIRLDKILLVGSPKWTLVGRPLIPQGMATVKAHVLEHRNIDPVIVFRIRKRKNYKKTNIHRQGVTLFQIGDIEVDDKFVVDEEPAIHPEDSIQSLK